MDWGKQVNWKKYLKKSPRIKHREQIRYVKHTLEVRDSEGVLRGYKIYLNGAEEKTSNIQRND